MSNLNKVIWSVIASVSFVFAICYLLIPSLKIIIIANEEDVVGDMTENVSLLDFISTMSEAINEYNDSDTSNKVVNSNLVMTGFVTLILGLPFLGYILLGILCIVSIRMKKNRLHIITPCCLIFSGILIFLLLSFYYRNIFVYKETIGYINASLWIIFSWVKPLFMIYFGLVIGIVLMILGIKTNQK